KMFSTSQQAPMGNRSTLITIGKNGELRHLFWPSHNYPQHVRGSLPGILAGRNGNESFSWLTDDPWIRKQRFLPASTILETSFAYGADKPSSQHQCGVHEEGSDAFVDAKDGHLGGNSLALHAGVKGVNSCLKWNLGDLPQGAREQLVLLMTFGHNKQQALDILD